MPAIESSLPQRVLLTGGSGFLGTAIINELLAQDSALTVSLLRIIDLKVNNFKDERIEFIQGDICDPEKVNQLCSGMDIVIHSAAIVDWGTKPEKEILRTNVEGTANVIRACKKEKVKFLVYTSSLDAIFGGKPLVNIDENIPYPEKHPNSYCRSKYLAEKLVTEANGPDLKTCILRPSDIYGEGDPFHIGSLIEMAKGGFYVRLGNGSTKSQHVYVGNMAHAHILAARALLEGNKAVAGNIYFITDGPPSNFFTFFDRIVEGSGYRIWPSKFNIPRNIAYVMGTISEGIAFLARPFRKYTPKFSRFAVIYTCSDFTFSTDKANKDFGFIPKYNADEAFGRTCEHFRKM